jgi:UDP-glucose 4-epimerase
MAENNGTCCVLGGTGFIGKALVAQLCKSGRSVRVVGRGQPPHALPAGASYVRADINDRASLRGLFDGASEVIDLIYGSVPKASFEDPVADIVAVLPSSVAVMEELACSKVDRFIYISSGGTVYGEALSVPMNEEHPTRPISPYGVTKLTLERYADLYRVCRNVPSIIARPGNAYGELQAGDIGQGFIATAMWHCLRQQDITVFGERGATRDYIHVDDIATALIALLDHGVIGETYNIGTGIGTDNVQILDLLAALAADSGVTMPEILINPARPFDVKTNVLDISKLSITTGWSPQINLSDGIRRCWNHVLDEHSRRAAAGLN